METTFKKMMLVNPDTWNMLTEKKITSLDSEMSSILNSELLDDEKAKRYSAALSSYRFYSTPRPQHVDPDSSALSRVPSQHRSKASKLLKLMKPHMSWAENGEIIINDVPVPYSDITHLMEKLFSGRRGATNGMERIGGGLNRARVPATLIPTAARQQQHQQQQQQQQQQQLLPRNIEPESAKRHPPKSALRGVKRVKTKKFKEVLSPKRLRSAAKAALINWDDNEQ